MKKILFSILLFLAIGSNGLIVAQQECNNPEREEWFMDMGFGMFIHWSVDSQMGMVISHSLAGASQDYMERFFTELPKTFNPIKFNPSQWAVAARLAGMKYVVFTAKHHSGFCMWDTATTDFNIMNTPFKRDALREIIEAFRAQGIAIGLYFSPEDFYCLYRQHIPVGRRMQDPRQHHLNNPTLMELDKAQIRELLTNYGKIDVMFFDGPQEDTATGLKQLAWELQPDVVVTRGQMETPEQQMPDAPLPGPWEACFTMGTDWQYKPTNDPHKSGTEIIDMLIETRAKGGNLLLNIGPKPDGEIQIEQEALLQEVALWNMVYGESIHNVRPWDIIREGNVWFTRSGSDPQTVYAFVEGGKEWPYVTRKDFFFSTLAGDANTRVSVLGYASELIEYDKDFDASLRFSATDQGVKISAVNGHRFYTNNSWPNRVVLKIEGVRHIEPVGKK